MNLCREEKAKAGAGAGAYLVQEWGKDGVKNDSEFGRIWEVEVISVSLKVDAEIQRNFFLNKKKLI